MRLRSTLLILCLTRAFAQNPDAPSIARAAASELAQGKIDAFYTRLDSEMMAVVPQPAFRDLVNALLLSTAGAFEKVESNPTCQAVKTVQICEVALQFQRARIRLRLLVDADGRIGGLFNLGREAR
jgi:hypothetical protein